MYRYFWSIAGRDAGSATADPIAEEFAPQRTPFVFRAASLDTSGWPPSISADGPSPTMEGPALLPSAADEVHQAYHPRQW